MNSNTKNELRFHNPSNLIKDALAERYSMLFTKSTFNKSGGFKKATAMGDDNKLQDKSDEMLSLPVKPK